MTALLGTLFLTALLLALAATVLVARSVLRPMRPVRVAVQGGPSFQSRTGTTLLTALADEDILLPAACGGAGTCGLCRLQVLEGAPEALPTELARLSRADLRGGHHLACQVVLRGDVAVALPEGLTAARNLDCEVASARLLTPLIREIVLALPPGADLPFEAGAFAQVTAPPFALRFDGIEVPEPHSAAWAHLRGLSVASDAPVTRAYSIANRPSDTHARRIVLLVRLALPPPDIAGAPPGVVSSWLFAVQRGDRVGLAGPFGSFRARESGHDMVFVGGGVGLAPLRAIIHDQLERRGTDWSIGLWYGVRRPDDLIYADEFEQLARRHRNFRYTVAVSEPAPGWDGPTGFVHTALRDGFLADHPAPESCDYYLCGPPLMTAAVRGLLAEAGVPESHVFNDDFGG